MPDRENVIRAWECCNPFNRRCNECPYEKDCYHDGISRHMVADAIALLNQQENDIHHMGLIIEEYEKELKKQEAVIRCKDCKYYRYYGLANDTVSECTINHCENHDGDWFCADGERQKVK